MNKITITKQKIYDKHNRLFAYELSFKDAYDHTTGLFTGVKETAKLIMSSISGKELDKLLGKNTLAFIEVDEQIITKGILDILDHERFVINILNTIELNENVLQKIIQYKKRGFKLCLENFDSTSEMIYKFKNLFNYIDILKMDIVLSQPQNMNILIKKFAGSHIKLLAQHIETKEDLLECKDKGFDYFQGYYLDKPEDYEILGSKEADQLIIIQLIRIIKEDKTNNEKLESFIRKQPDLSFKLIEFFNHSRYINVKVSSLPQVITMLGRQKLLRWLLVYLYSEVSINSASETVLELAIKRAERMEQEASPQNKDKAYLAGMFSMLGSIFETDTKELVKYINLDDDIKSLVLEKKGIFAGSLMRAEIAEKEYLKKLYMQNFDKLNTNDLVSTLEIGGIKVDKNKII